MAINPPVEIFVIKKLSVLNLVVVTQGNRFRLDAKTYHASVARIGATLNC